MRHKVGTLIAVCSLKRNAYKLVAALAGCEGQRRQSLGPGRPTSLCTLQRFGIKDCAALWHMRCGHAQSNVMHSAPTDSRAGLKVLEGEPGIFRRRRLATSDKESQVACCLSQHWLVQFCITGTCA